MAAIPGLAALFNKRWDKTKTFDFETFAMIAEALRNLGWRPATERERLRQLVAEGAYGAPELRTEEGYRYLLVALAGSDNCPSTLTIALSSYDRFVPEAFSFSQMHYGDIREPWEKKGDRTLAVIAGFEAPAALNHLLDTYVSLATDKSCDVRGTKCIPDSASDCLRVLEEGLYHLLSRERLSFTKEQLERIAHLPYYIAMWSGRGGDPHDTRGPSEFHHKCLNLARERLATPEG